jgi:DNA replication and repair protein RecF
MILNNLHLTNFRNHSKANFDFNGNNTLIFGANGSGKTNILEAIHLISTTKSIKAEYDSEMINHEADFCRVDALIDNEHEQKLELVIKKLNTGEHTSSKTVKINGVAKALNKFAGSLNSVLFSPDEIAVLTGSPSGRRKYIDSIFFQTDQKYKKAHAEYQKALRGRNKILETIRETGRGKDLIELWEEKLASTADILQTARLGLFEFFSIELKKYEKIVNGENVEIKVDFVQSYVNKEVYALNRQKEIYAGKTLYGPHRDDFDIKLNGYSVASFGSRGQQRAVLLALKLCEMDYIEKANGERPILLLDDIFSELDEGHRNSVVSIMDLQQTIVTTSETLSVADKFKVEIAL